MPSTGLDIPAGGKTELDLRLHTSTQFAGSEVTLKARLQHVDPDSDPANPQLMTAKFAADRIKLLGTDPAPPGFAVDLQVAGIAESKEENPGVFVKYNDDYDEGATDSIGSPVPDYDQFFNNGQLAGMIKADFDHTTTTGDDDELADAKLTITAPSGTKGKWSVTTFGLGSAFNIWYVDDNATPADTTDDKWIAIVDFHESAEITIPAAGTLEVPLKVEGIAPSSGLRNASVNASFTITGGATKSDQAEVTVFDLLDSELTGSATINTDDEAIEVSVGAAIVVNADDDDQDGTADTADGIVKQVTGTTT